MKLNLCDPRLSYPFSHFHILPSVSSFTCIILKGNTTHSGCRDRHKTLDNVYSLTLCTTKLKAVTLKLQSLFQKKLKSLKSKWATSWQIYWIGGRALITRDMVGYEVNILHFSSAHNPRSENKNISILPSEAPLEVSLKKQSHRWPLTLPLPESSPILFLCSRSWDYANRYIIWRT